VLGRPGELEIVEEQAETVRRIFEEFAHGKTARDIAGGLNADKIEPPSDLRWNASTIYGNVQRGNGILLNEIYVGQIVWNKVTMVKDPSTGKRLSRPNPTAKHGAADEVEVSHRAIAKRPSPLSDVWRRHGISRPAPWGNSRAVLDVSRERIMH
jgi:hypothetical protein